MAVKQYIFSVILQNLKYSEINRKKQLFKSTSTKNIKKK